MSIVALELEEVRGTRSVTEWHAVALKLPRLAVGEAFGQRVVFALERDDVVIGVGEWMVKLVLRRG